jgi:flagellar FliJ protein
VNPPAFKFRLEDVRALRERAESTAKGDLAESLSSLEDGESALHRAQLARDAARGSLRDRAQAGVSGEELMAASAYLDHTERSRRAAGLDLGRREADVEARRDALVLASRERELLERLKDRRRAEHTRRAIRIENAALDEMAVSRHRRGGIA